MKSTGIVRKVDELGRIVLPIELTKNLDINIKDPLEIFIDGKSIVLKKFHLVTCDKCEIRIDNEDKFCKNCGCSLKGDK